MFINSNYIVDQDAHHGATFDSIWYLFTCQIIHDRGRRHDNMMMFWSSSSIYWHICRHRPRPNRPMAIFLLKMVMTTIRVIKFIILKNDDNFIGKISCILSLIYFIYSGTVHVGIKLIKCLTNMRLYIKKLWWTGDVPNTIMTKPTHYVHMSIMIE